MKRAIAVALGIATVVSSAAAIGFGASSDSAPEPLGREQYFAARAGLDSASAGATALCEVRDVSLRDLCRAEVIAYQMVRGAELEDGYRRTRATGRAAQRARIEARYQVDRAKCSTLGGGRRDACLVKAHAARGRALLEAAAPYAESRS